MTDTLADQSARDRIRNDLDETLIVEAAAGTGKTTELVRRIIAVIKSGRGKLSHLVAVTFTEKAAGELKLRLRSELERARRDAAGDRVVIGHLEEGLSQLEEAHIGTIHGFCSDLLKERPLQAGVDPFFEVATEDEAQRLYRRVFLRWLQEKLDDPAPGIRRLLREPVDKEVGPVDRLKQAGWALIERRDFPTPWEIRPFAREKEIDWLTEKFLKIAKLGAECVNPKDTLYLDLAGLRSFAIELDRQETASGERDYDYLEHRLPKIDLGKRKGRGAFSDRVSRQEILDERDGLVESLKDFRKRAGADRAAHLHSELSELVERYREIKTKVGRLDFLDLLVKTRDLLRDDASLREELQNRFTHIFVDEFQDTDPLQAEILLLLASDDPRVDDWHRVRPRRGKLFAVADPKQSIYRFRRADVSLYQDIKRRLIDAGTERVFLSVSFRGLPEIQEMVNTVMSEVMTGSEETHQASYVSLDQFREPIVGQPAIVALPIPRPYSSYGNVVNYAIEKSEPRAVATWVKWLIEESDWKVTSRDRPEPHEIRPSDICLLFRRFQSGGRDITRPYVDGLQARDVAHVLVGGRGFHQREEIDAMRSALAAVERPDDELAVFSALRSPLFSLADDALLLFRTRHGTLHPFRELPGDLTESDMEVVSALEVLALLHKGRNHQPIALTIRRLLDETRAQAGFALWQAGDQILANVLRLIQLARNFETTGGLSFRGFVQHLEELAEQGDVTEQPLIEEGVQGVRLMTVHRAKGLEFPVVILCDITCSISDYASRHIDPDRKLFAVRLAGGAPWELIDHGDVEGRREKAESQRLLYVAATRARDLLVVPAVADGPRYRSWVATLTPGLYPESKTYRLPVVALNTPRFGDETTLDRPMGSQVPPGEGIKPGLHKPRKGSHRVLWWDAALLDEPSQIKPSIRRDWILRASEGEGADPGAERYVTWRRHREELLKEGARPALVVTTATRAAETELPLLKPERAEEVSIEVVDRTARRPTGKGFGTLVHEVLATTEFDADREQVHARAATLGRVFGNTEEEVVAATDAVSQALTHPLLRQAAASVKKQGLALRESPIVLRTEEGSLIEGVMDLAFRSGPEAPWTVVDFKTDVRTDIRQEEYRRQVALYAEALGQASGAEARGVLLYV